MLYLKKSVFILLILSHFSLAESIMPDVYRFDWDYNPDKFLSYKNDSLINLTTWKWRVDGAEWQTIKLPFFTEYKELIILKTTFKVSDKQNLKLISMGILGTVNIYLNGKFLHFHSNDHIAFDINLPAAQLRTNADNEIELHIKPAGSTREGYPHVVNLLKEKEYLGILRPILIGRSRISPITSYESKCSFSNEKAVLNFQYNIKINQIVNEKTKRITIEEILSDSDANVIARRGIYTIPAKVSRRELEFNISDERLWSPENPQHLVLQIKIKVGIRTVYSKSFEIRPRVFSSQRSGLYLNNKAIDVRGINYHQNLGNFRDRKYYSTLKEQLSIIRKFGFNAVRFTHHVPDPAVFHLADSIGLLIFSELPIWRYPTSLFSNDFLMEHAKASIRNLRKYYSKYASFVTLGIGQEIPLHEPAGQKFMLILKTMVNTHLSAASYLSPLPVEEPFSKEAADIYLLDIYRPVQSIDNSERRFGYPFQLCGKIGFLNDPQLLKSDPANLDRKLFLSQDIKAVYNNLSLRGGFIESFQDWTSELPSHISKNSPQEHSVIANGLFFDDGRPKPELLDLQSVWDLAKTETIYFYPETRKTNFFSILLFIALIIFLTISRKNKRLSENVKRSLVHPYGFFVDMRERRIIPLFNSIIVGLFAALILSSGFASFFYFYRNSFGLQEITASILAPLGLYENYLQISHSLSWLTFSFTLLFLLYPVFISLILKLISFFTTERVRYRQSLAIGLWSGIPLFFLFPVSMVSYQMIYYQNYENMILIALAIFILWTHLRIINGIRVLFFTKPIRVFMIMLLSYMVPVFIFWAVFHPEFYWIDYLKLILDTRILF